MLKCVHRVVVEFCIQIEQKTLPLHSERTLVEKWMPKYDCEEARKWHFQVERINFF